MAFSINVHNKRASGLSICNEQVKLSASRTNRAAVLFSFFFPFLDFYFPTLSREIDHGKLARNLDRELRKLAPALALVKILSDLTAASLGLRFTL